LRKGEGQTSDAAAFQKRIALFGHDATAACKCSLVEGMDSRDCDELGVFDRDNEHIATFHGREFRCTQEPPTEDRPIGGLVVYRVPGGEQGTRDRNIVWAAETNRRNSAYWMGNLTEADRQ
jgi:hypothetical protein